MPTVDEIQRLKGQRVLMRLTPAGGGQTVEGRLVGTLDAADGTVVIVEPAGHPERRFSCNYQHIAAIAQA